MRDILQEIWATTRRNKLRTALTGFAVAWGIFMLIVLLGAGNGLINAQERSNHMGMTNSMSVYGGQTSKAYKGYKEGRPITLNDRDRSTTAKQFPDIVEESGAVLQAYDINIVLGENSYATSLEGATPVYKKVNKKELMRGRFINDIDLQEERRVIVLTQNQAEELLPRQPLDIVGKQVAVGPFSYQVVGVMHQDMANMNEPAVVPFTTLRAIYGKYNQADEIYFSFKNINSKAESEDFEKLYKSAIASNHDAAPDDDRVVWIWNRFEQSLQMAQGENIIKTALWIIGILTLLSGIVGVSNIMLISVKERTREFGIRKAIGAKPRQILSLVVTESVIITTFFGYVGMVLGVAANLYMDSTLGQMKQNIGFMDVYMFLNPIVDINTCMAATVLMVVAGTLAGLVPARKAARVKPIEALRAE